MRYLALAILTSVLVGNTACSSVKSWTRPGYEVEDRTSVLRLVVVPKVNAGPEVAALVGRVALRYANHHRDFITRDVVSSTASPCRDDLEGVLRVELTLSPGSKTKTDGRAELRRCSDDALIWYSEHSGSYPDADDNLAELTASYTEELGPTVTSLVSPVFQTVRRLLDHLPVPEMPNDDYVMEKIELED